MAADSVLDLLAATTTAGIIAWSFDRATGEITWSAEFEATFGWDHEMARARSAWRTHVHPDDLGGLVATGREAIETGRPFRSVYRVVTRSGTRWVEVAGGLVGSGPEARLTGIMVDITDRLDEDASTLAAASDAQTALHLIGAVVWKWDVDARVVSIEIHGEPHWSCELPEGTVTEAELFSLVDSAQHEAMRACVLAGRTTGVQRHRLTSAVGGHAVRSHWMTQTDREGRVVRVVGVTVPDQ